MTTQAGEYKKPLPRPMNTELTKPFWDAAKRHELVLPRCRKCSRYHFYPRELCPFCLSQNLEWVPASGRGYLYTYAVVNQPGHPAFAADVPYVYAIVRLVEGVTMPSNVVDYQSLDDLRVDMPLVALFDDATPEWTLVKFKPA